MSVVNAASGELPTAEALFNHAWQIADWWAGKWFEEFSRSRQYGDVADMLAQHYDGMLLGLALVLEEHPSYLGPGALS